MKVKFIMSIAMAKFMFNLFYFLEEFKTPVDFCKVSFFYWLQKYANASLHLLLFGIRIFLRQCDFCTHFGSLKLL